MKFYLFLFYYFVAGGKRNVRRQMVRSIIRKTPDTEAFVRLTNYTMAAQDWIDKQLVGKDYKRGYSAVAKFEKKFKVSLKNYWFFKILFFTV